MHRSAPGASTAQTVTHGPAPHRSAPEPGGDQRANPDGTQVQVCSNSAIWQRCNGATVQRCNGANMRDTTEANGTTDILKALADPTRRQIRQDLKHCELATGGIAASSRFPGLPSRVTGRYSKVPGWSPSGATPTASSIHSSKIASRCRWGSSSPPCARSRSCCDWSVIARAAAQPKGHQPKRHRPKRHQPAGQHGQHSGVGVTIRIPALSATIERRPLINYRRDPAVARTLLPSSLRPQLVKHSAVAEICLLSPAPCDPLCSTGVNLPLRSVGAQRTPPTASLCIGMTRTALTRVSTCRSDAAHPGWPSPPVDVFSPECMGTGGSRAARASHESASLSPPPETRQGLRMSRSPAPSQATCSPPSPMPQGSSRRARSAGRPRVLDSACSSCISPPIAGELMPVKCSRCSPASSTRSVQGRRHWILCS